MFSHTQKGVAIMLRWIPTFKSWINRKPVRRTYRPTVEMLEGRCLFAAVTWTGAVSSVWATGGNWQGKNGQAPGANDDVTIKVAEVLGNWPVLTSQAEVKSVTVE